MHLHAWFKGGIEIVQLVHDSAPFLSSIYLILSRNPLAPRGGNLRRSYRILEDKVYLDKIAKAHQDVMLPFEGYEVINTAFDFELAAGGFNPRKLAAQVKGQFLV